MTYTEACKLATIPRGEWNASSEYRSLDLVTYNDEYYLALNSSVNQTPSDGSDYWTLIVNDHVVAGRIVAVLRGEWSSDFQYKKLDVITYNDKTYLALVESTNQPPTNGSDSYWMLLVAPYLADMVGATADADGEAGLVPEPKAGDQDSVLLGDGTWNRKLQTSIINNNDSVRGYMDSEGEFKPFITYDEAIRNSLVGTANPEDVLIGKTFSNSTSRGLSGTMRDHRTRSQLVVTNGASDSNKPAMRKTTVNGTAYYEVTMPYGVWSWSFGNSSALIPAEEKTVTGGASTITVEPTGGRVLSKVIVKPGTSPSQEKTVTAGTSSITVKPDSGKLLSKVTVNPTPSQSKTITASRSNQTVKPDSGKLLSQVVVNKYPDASGTYVCGANNGSSSNNDMGATNNYRYVDATAIFNYGKSSAHGTGGVIGSATSDFAWGMGCSVTINTVKDAYYIAYCIGASKTADGENLSITNATMVSYGSLWRNSVGTQCAGGFKIFRANSTSSTVSSPAAGSIAVKKFN